MSKHENVHAAFVAACRDIGSGVGKDSQNPHFRSDYASLEAVMRAIKPALDEHGLAVHGSVEWVDGMAFYRQAIIHESGSVMTGSIPVYSTKTGGPQGFGAGVTYSRRFLTMAQFGLAPEDDDGETAQGRNSTHKPTDRATDQERRDVWGMAVEYHQKAGEPTGKDAIEALLNRALKAQFDSTWATMTSEQGEWLYGALRTKAMNAAGGRP